jgi:hypothetical protein
MKKDRFTILEEDPTIYPCTHLHPVIYMRATVTQYVPPLKHSRGCQPPQTQLLPDNHCMNPPEKTLNPNYWASLHDRLPYFFMLDSKHITYKGLSIQKKICTSDYNIPHIKVLPPYSLINHAAGSLFCFADIFNYPKDINSL